MRKPTPEITHGGEGASSVTQVVEAEGAGRPRVRGNRGKRCWGKECRSVRRRLQSVERSEVRLRQRFDDLGAVETRSERRKERRILLGKRRELDAKRSEVLRRATGAGSDDEDPTGPVRSSETPAQLRARERDLPRGFNLRSAYHHGPIFGCAVQMTGFPARASTDHWDCAKCRPDAERRLLELESEVRVQRARGGGLTDAERLRAFFEEERQTTGW